jgi:hypothetical protein
MIMLLATRVRLFVALMVLVSVTANCSPNSPSPILAFNVTASPNPIVGVVCAGCGAGSTDREAATTLSIRETGGASGTVTSILMILRNTATAAVVAQGELTAAAIAQTPGSGQLAANGTVGIQVGVHYPSSEQGRAGALTLTVRVTDSRGTVATQEILVPVSAM